MTHTLRPGESEGRADEYDVPSIVNGESCVRKFQLSYLYDLSALGKYTAYAEVYDPVSHRRLRTNVVTFTLIDNH